MPKRKQDTIESVSVEWLLRHLRASGDGYNLDCDGYQTDKSFSVGVDYVAMLDCKTSDEKFGPLVGAIIENGFDTPIMIYINDNNRLEIINGHHRLCAAILLCLDSINVYWTRNWSGNGWNVSSGSYKIQSSEQWRDLGELNLWKTLSHA